MAIKASTTVTITAYRDTKSVTRYYKLVSATASAPTIAQTVKPSEISGLGWTDTEPTYTSDSTNILYFFDASVFSDDTWLYSKVSKSSSYEAAKQAYNKAQSASDTASAAKDSIDNLSDKTRSGYIETLSGSGFAQSTKTEDGGMAEVVVYGKSVQDGTPTPEAPVEIQSVENPKVTACRKNLFNPQVLVDLGWTQDGNIFHGGDNNIIDKILWKNDCGITSQFTLSWDYKYPETATNQGSFFVIRYTDGTPAYARPSDVPTSDYGHYVFISDESKTVKEITSTYGSRSNDTYFRNIQLEISSTATDYEPYQAKTATLSDIVLRSTPYGTKDRLFKDTDGLWKIERNIENFILDGVTAGKKLISWGSAYMPNANGLYCFYFHLPINKTLNAICSHFKATSGGIANSNTNESYFVGENEAAITWSMCFKDVDGVTSAETANQWLADEYANGNPVTVYYPKGTPTYETLPDSIQAELNALTTYNPVTNVMVSDGITPDIDVSFWTRDYRAKSMAENAQTSADNAQTGVDSLNDTVFGVQTFEYVLDGVTIPAHKREDGTYYYILNDAEVDVAEADLVHDSDGELTSYQEGGIYDDIEAITGNIEAIDTKLNSFDARETAIYNTIQDNSLIARKNARVEGNSLIITNDTVTEDIASLLNYLQLNYDSIVIYGNGKDIVTIAKTADDSGYMKMNGTSMLQAQESRLSTIRLRSADGTGNLALVAGSDGHVSLREVL